MGLNPKCLVQQAVKQGRPTPTDAELTALSTKIPLAAKCVTCPLRAKNALTDFCYLRAGSEI